MASLHGFLLTLTAYPLAYTVSSNQPSHPLTLQTDGWRTVFESHQPHVAVDRTITHLGWTHLHCVHRTAWLTFELKPYKIKKLLLRAGPVKGYFLNEGSLPQE